MYSCYLTTFVRDLSQAMGGFMIRYHSPERVKWLKTKNGGQHADKRCV
ncbi:hypothetical protein VCRA2119O381_1170006 [Vibrio crassostreae]|nr:hypothetical protein VCRA2119O381_1170006 [Vibrio crassostreae]